MGDAAGQSLAAAPVAAPTWKPLSELPCKPGTYVTIRTPDGLVCGWRWLAYRKGSQPPYVGGRWQEAHEYGFKNATLPAEGEWVINLPVQRD